MGKETIKQKIVKLMTSFSPLHEDDISAFFLSGNDERQWETVILKSIDDAGNCMYPEIHPLFKNLR